jgi:hypothetical protein
MPLRESWVLLAVLSVTGCGLQSGDESDSHSRNSKTSALVSETFFLDTYEEANDGAAGPVFSKVSLDAGRPYRITLHGTFSIWSNWASTCGSPEPLPIYPSPETSNGYAVFDAQFQFASPGPSCTAEFPSSHTGIQFNLTGGADWAPAPADASVSADHHYTYIMMGQGASLGVRFIDYPTTDNYGRIRITVESINRPPDCSAASPSVSRIWSPNHQMVPVSVLGVTDPDNDPISITITSIRQDEPVNTVGDGNTEVDGTGVGTSTAEVRAERTGNRYVPGNGRVYQIGYSATDGNGATCSGVVKVGVPHDQGGRPLSADDGPIYDSTAP